MYVRNLKRLKGQLVKKETVHMLIAVHYTLLDTLHSTIGFPLPLLEEIFPTEKNSLCIEKKGKYKGHEKTEEWLWLPSLFMFDTETPLDLCLIQKPP